MSIKLFALIGWCLFIISPFAWRAFDNWYDEKHKDEVT